ncbi:MAG: tetratricopeptide repeat protein [Verrucomicrobiales bacterium]|nr:tetratricopeptide repeat protein [Verrucomicrobiales bacterium]
MSRIFDIVLGTTVLAASIGLVAWALYHMLKRSDDPMKLLFKWAFTIPFVIFCIWTAGHIGVAGPFLIVFMAVVLSPMWAPHIGELLAKPLAGLYDGGTEPPDPKPLYSTAMTKRKLNKPLEAVVEIRKQLAKFPNDYEGVALLASIQAEDMKDLPGAEITFNHFCDRKDAPPLQVAAALTQLADWHLKIAQDADSARAVLEKIIARFPGTALAAQAAQRIAHLGGAEKILSAAHDRQAMFLPEGVNNIGLLDSTEFLRPTETDPEKLAAEYVKHLEQHPQDTEAREELAIIYARHYQRLDLAALELEQLINEPNQPVKRVAHWLNLLADLQIHGGADYDTVRGTLEQIVERFPDLPVAEIAQSRLGRLKLEIKGQKETPGKKLGVYEQNIGLKYGSPRQL